MFIGDFLIFIFVGDPKDFHRRPEELRFFIRDSKILSLSNEDFKGLLVLNYETFFHSLGLDTLQKLKQID